MINKHVYSPEKYRSLSSLTSLFKVLIFAATFMAFSLSLTRVITYDIDLQKVQVSDDISIPHCLKIFISKIISFALHPLFSQKGNHKSNLIIFLRLPLARSCPQLFTLNFLQGWYHAEEGLVIYKRLFSWDFFL